MEVSILYRVEGRATTSMSMSDFEEEYHASYNLSVDKFNVLSETKQGYWIDIGMPFKDEPPTKKWVSKYSKKRFAHPTEKEAYESFIARKKRQIKILKSQINGVEIFLNLANKKLN